MSEIEEIKLRLHNTELALTTFIAIVVDLQPFEVASNITKLTHEYIDAIQSCGAQFDGDFKKLNQSDKKDP